MSTGFIVCEHIKDDGVRCGSPALKQHRFCFYHQRLYDPAQLPGTAEYRPPVLDTPNSIQLMIRQLQRAYLAQTITDRQMTNLLYSLQLASNVHLKVQVPSTNEVCTAMTSGMLDTLHLTPDEYEVAPDVPHNVIPVPRSPEAAVQLARQLITDASPELRHAIQMKEAELEMM